jgi:hypothetical protein
MALFLKDEFRNAGLMVCTVVVALGLLTGPAVGQPALEADGARLLAGAIDMHFHVDVPKPDGSMLQGDFSAIRRARSLGMRALVLKSHYDPTTILAYHLRLESPGFEVFGGLVLNRVVGGINSTAVDHMATQSKGNFGKVVWMPTELVVPVSQNSKLLPEVKEVVSIIAKHNLVLATGHLAPEDALRVLQEGRAQGVQHMIATHPMDGSAAPGDVVSNRRNPPMTIDQMIEAAKLGAIIEFDFRKILNGNGGEAAAIRKIGPEHCLIDQFWTKYVFDETVREYGNPETVGKFVEKMRSHGFSDRELDIMTKDNPARLLNLSVSAN